jgi:hypothetical protein
MTPLGMTRFSPVRIEATFTVPHLDRATDRPVQSESQRGLKTVKGLGRNWSCTDDLDARTAEILAAEKVARANEDLAPPCAMGRPAHDPSGRLPTGHPLRHRLLRAGPPVLATPTPVVPRGPSLSDKGLRFSALNRQNMPETRFCTRYPTFPPEAQNTT